MGGLSSADGTYTILDGATIGKSYNEAGLTSIYVTTPFTNMVRKEQKEALCMKSSIRLLISLR